MPSDDIEIRESRPGDLAALERLYPDAFPDEDLLPLLRDLLAGRADVTSLVAEVDGRLTGHIVFTTCGVAGPAATVSLLGPLAVAPAWQRRGIGSLLIRRGLQRAGEAGAQAACVLGDPAYYGRFGFRPETGITPPYPLPAEWRDAWQSVPLGGVHNPIAGTLDVPPPWQHSALWAA